MRERRRQTQGRGRLEMGSQEERDKMSGRRWRHNTQRCKERRGDLKDEEETTETHGDRGTQRNMEMFIHL